MELFTRKKFVFLRLLIFRRLLFSHITLINNNINKAGGISGYC